MLSLYVPVVSGVLRRTPEIPVISGVSGDSWILRRTPSLSVVLRRSPSCSGRHQETPLISWGLRGIPDNSGDSGGLPGIPRGIPQRIPRGIPGGPKES